MHVNDVGYRCNNFSNYYYYCMNAFNLINAMTML